MPRSATVVAGVVLGFSALAAGDADAALYRFYGGNAYNGPYKGAGTVYDLIKTSGTGITCPIGAGASCTNATADQLGDPLTFADFTASTGDGSGPLKVNEDLVPNYGGMGVDGDGDDQINGSNILTLTFNTKTFITGIATLFASGHTPFGGGFGNSTVPTEAQLAGKGIKVNGTAYTFAAVNAGGLSIAGTGALGNIFTFEIGTGAVDYYVSGLSTVPLPGALLLFGSAMAGLAGYRRLRKGDAAAPAAA